MKKQGKNFQLYIVALALLVVTTAAYLPVLRVGFVNYDDEPYVTQNTHVQSGLTAEGLKWAFNIGYQGNWHPVTWVSHMLDCQFFGLSPTAHHAVNLLLHLANTLLLLFVLNRMTKSLWKSAFVAALFAVHPMHVESVAWIAERKDVLSTLFWMLTMWAYVRYTDSPNLKRYSVVVVVYALGLMSKPTLVTLPFVLMLLDYWPLNRWASERWMLVREKIPLLIMSAASCVITYVAQQRGEAIRTVAELPLSSRIENTPVAYVSYIAKMFWPTKLAVFYPHPLNVPLWHAAVAVLILAVVTVVAIRLARSRPYLIVGWLWYLAVLVPMIGLVQVGGQAMADRYTYLSFIGLFIMLTWGITDLLSHRVPQSPRTHVPLSPSLLVIPVLVIIILACFTWRQTGYWRDSVTLWTHALSVTARNDMAHYGLGNAYASLGDNDKAIEEFRQAVDIEPGFPEAHYNLGIAYHKLGRYAEAVEAYKQAVRINPNEASAYNNMGNAYINLGKYAEAVNAYKQTLRADPSHPKAHYNMGVAYCYLGRFVDALGEYQQAVHMDPNNDKALYNLGDTYGRLGRYAEAADAFSQVTRIRPDYAEARFKLGYANVLLGNRTLAMNEYKALTNLDPVLANRLLSLINK